MVGDTVTALAIIGVALVALVVFVWHDMRVDRRHGEQLRRDVEELRRQYREDKK